MFNFYFQFRDVRLFLAIILLAWFLLPANKALANQSLSAPVPTYDTVTSYLDKTEVTVPENLQKSWRGNFTLEANSRVKFINYQTESVLIYHATGEFKPKTQTRTFSHNPASVYAWTKQIAKSVDTQTKDPELSIKNGYATHFVPPVVGKKLDRYQSSLKILQNLELGQNTIELTVKSTVPSKNLSALNNLGIKELIGRGESNFSGSPANRRHNIKVGMSKMKGVIIKPGEEFSFNKYLGPVEASEGFLPELVIKGYETIPELGGGLCQVSSTTFRAAMHAGLPITQRRNHSYAVRYYAPQGTDATIYPGVIDLKFKNDTGNSILIWPYFKGSDILIFDFYGTRDGRQVVLNQPATFDKQANGAMKASWSRTVTKNGVTNTDRFSSNYKPPELFKKREEFVPNPEAPTTSNPNQLPAISIPNQPAPNPTETPSTNNNDSN